MGYDLRPEVGWSGDLLVSNNTLTLTAHYVSDLPSDCTTDSFCCAAIYLGVVVSWRLKGLDGSSPVLQSLVR